MQNYSNRLQRCQLAMEQQGWEQLIVTSRANLYYLTGYRPHVKEPMPILYLSLEKRPLLLVHSRFEDDRELPIDLDIECCEEEVPPLTRLGPLLQPRGTIGIDQNWQCAFLFELMKACPACTFAKSGIVEELRERKEEGELRLLRQVSRITDAVLHHVIQLQHLPATELQMAQTVRSFFADHQVHELAFPPVIRFGRNNTFPYHTSGEWSMRLEEPISMAIGGRYHNYCSTLKRHAFFGHNNSDFESIAQVISDAQLMAIESMKPGVRIGEVYSRMQQQLSTWGRHATYPYLLGHGIGLEAEEGPYLHPNNQTVLQPGMVFLIEPGLIVSDQYAVQIGDMVAITETGAELLTRSPKEVQYFDPLEV